MERAKTIWQCRFPGRVRSAFGWCLSTAPDLWSCKWGGQFVVVLGPARRHSDFDQRHLKHQRLIGVPRPFRSVTDLIRSSETLGQCTGFIVAWNRHLAGGDLT